MFFLLLAVLPACSGGGGNPVTPPFGSNDSVMDSSREPVPTVASDILYDASSKGMMAYKALGIFEVTLDPKTMTAELTPTRKAEGIGLTFDADLTQFLRISLCKDCLKIDGIRLAGTNQIEVGFAIKHPFADITKRPDLHVFDVRGIVISNGNYNFPLTLVSKSPTSLVSARANTSLVANADGYTHHFVELASDPNYFNPPKSYNANVNPYKRYYEDGSTPVFNPQNPTGYNVMKVGADWQSQKFLFNVAPGPIPIDFVFVVDCSYGQSAVFKNRMTPYYFLPEFNRKEAWKVEIEENSGQFQSNTPASSVEYKVSVCDWQAGIAAADPLYPDNTNLDGLSAVSKVKAVTIEIPSVSGLVQKTTADSGDGSSSNPFIFNITVTNSGSAPA